ncbi:MAG: hypothetical protein RLZZ324_863 [Candidatus Parcubacteria bacterium]|jgi:hypothetical protein
MLRRWLLILVTYLPPVVVGAGMLALARLVGNAPEDARAWLVWACFAAVTVVTFASSMAIAMRIRRPLAAARLALTPTLLAAPAFAAFMLVRSDTARVAVALVTAGLLAANAAFVAGMKGLDARYHAGDLKHLAFAIRVVSAFFTFHFAFNVTSISTGAPFDGILSLIRLSIVSPALNAAIAAAITGLVCGLIAHETLSDEAFTHRPPAILSAAIAALGFQFHLALAMLPVSGLTDAAVLLTLFTTALVAVVLTLRGAVPPKRHFVLAAVLVIAVLLSARWQ